MDYTNFGQENAWDALADAKQGFGRILQSLTQSLLKVCRICQHGCPMRRLDMQVRLLKVFGHLEKGVQWYNVSDTPSSEMVDWSPLTTWKDSR
jgi:hypothetical protein